ncbi:MAG: glycosyltransferase family protein [Thermodesulfobacteriota bacterium]
MARILYGVQCTGHGHAVRGLTIARHFREHEFLFVSSWMGADVLRDEFRVLDLPQPASPVHNHRLSLTGTLLSALKMRVRSKQIMGRLLEAVDRFQPDVTVSDYENFVARLSRQLGIPCLSLDHQHIITACRHQVPWRQMLGYLGAYYAIRTHFDLAQDYLVISFFRPPMRPQVRAKILPPLLRETVLTRQPRNGDHVVAYQGYTTFENFFTFLKHIPSPVKVYGFNEDRVEGNLFFKKKSEAGFLEDLSACRYVVCGGSHTLISEALYYGKPVISFPIKNQIEQFLNAHYVEKLGYGRCFTGFSPRAEIIPAFEDRLDHYRANIRAGDFCGNQEIFRLVDQFIREKKLDY